MNCSRDPYIIDKYRATKVSQLGNSFPGEFFALLHRPLMRKTLLRHSEPFCNVVSRGFLKRNRVDLQNRSPLSYNKVSASGILRIRVSEEIF